VLRKNPNKGSNQRRSMRFSSSDRPWGEIRQSKPEPRDLNIVGRLSRFDSSLERRIGQRKIVSGRF